LRQVDGVIESESALKDDLAFWANGYRRNRHLCRGHRDHHHYQVNR
jgi:hypothetical protein